MAHDSVPRRSSGLGRLLREPLLHFVLIGAALFAGISLAREMHRPQVRIEARELEQLAAYWAQQTQRPPTKAELAAIIRERIDEELLAREAVRLGLDTDDMIVRRRLAQKMSFASEDTGAIAEPDEATLRAFMPARRRTTRRRRTWPCATSSSAATAPACSPRSPRPRPLLS